MTLSPNSFFGNHIQFREFNLNKYYLNNREYLSDIKNPTRLNQCIRMQANADYPEIIETFGGYGEDRSDVWKGTYLDETGGYIHLGIDINMGMWSPVYAPFSAVIVDKFTDTDDKIGWGGRLILENDSNSPLLVLGHLNPKTLTTKKIVKKGDLLGKVGHWPTNGNTFWHLHIQCINHRNFRTFDGYGFKKDLKDNPNPFKVNFS